jgi:hypothetical protein
MRFILVYYKMIKIASAVFETIIKALALALNVKDTTIMDPILTRKVFVASSSQKYRPRTTAPTLPPAPIMPEVELVTGGLT